MALSSSILLQYAYRNQVRTDGLRVATEGVFGAERASDASADFVLDVVVPQSTIVSCAATFELSVSQGGTVARSGSKVVASNEARGLL